MNCQTRELQKLCYDVFKFADEGGKGYLCCEDYKVAVIALLGYKPSPGEMTSLWGRGQNEKLSLEQFTEAMIPRLQGREKDQLIRDVFLAFDRRCKGFLSLSECQEEFRKVCPHVREEQVEAWFRELDSDMDGRVSYRDFQLMMLHFKLV